MEKVITIGDKEVLLKSSAAIPRMYRIKFGRDIFTDLTELKNDVKKSKSLSIKSLEMFENIAYLMAKHGDKNVPNTVEEWLDEFETFEIYKVLPEILELWHMETEQKSTPKKKNGK